ncbi:MAG: DUF2207 domain-containing protein, partial [Deinococcota bacterium]
MHTHQPKLIRGQGHPLKRTLNYLISTCLLLSAAVSLAQTYTWRDVVQTVTIEADGDVLVTDERTLTVQGGDFGEAFVEVLLEPDQNLVMLTEDSGSLTTWQGATAYQNRIDNGQEVVVGNPNRITQTRIQEARVRYVYRLKNTLDVYSDVVQWYWNTIGVEDVAVQNYTLQVNAPGPMNEPYDAYVHRYSNLEEPEVVLSADRSQLTVRFGRIPASEGVEIRYLMDPSLFEATSTTPGLENLLRDEARIAGVRTAARRFRAVRASRWWFAPVTAVLGVLLFGIAAAYRRVGREPKLPTLQYQFEPPSDLPPAALPALFQQRFTSSSGMSAAFHATVMDLARRGYGDFRGDKGRFGKAKFGMQLHLDKDSSGLHGFERDVLNYLKQAAASKGEGEVLEFEELKSYSQKRLSGFMSAWGHKVRNYVEAQMGGKLITPESLRAANRWSLTGLACTIILGILATQVLGAARVAVIIGASLSFVLIIVASASLPAWRPEVAREVYAWRGFKRTLRDFSQMKNAPDDFFKLWDTYYCYAAALGVAKQFLKNIARAAPLRGVDEGNLTRSAHWMGGNTMSSSDFSSFSKSISSLSSALNSASASASSGGSSSGGGGGGG